MTEPHTINHDLRNQLLSALGMDRARTLADMLSHFGVPQAEREHLYYPLVLGWLAQESAAPDDVSSASDDLVRKHSDGNPGGHLLSQFKGYVRAAQLRRLGAEQRTRERLGREDAARSRVPARVEVMGVELRQPAPPEFQEWCHRAAKLCAELRQLGRSPRELPEDIALWPASYLTESS